MVALLHSAALVLVLAGLGWPLANRPARGLLTDWERVVPALLAGGLVAYLGVFAVGMVRYDRASMTVLSLVLIAAAVPGWRRMPWRRLAGAAAELRQDRVALALAVLAVLVGLSSLVQGLAPPNDYDSLAYHLVGPKADLENQRITAQYRWGMVHFLFPAYMHHLYRLVLATVGEAGTQLVHGWFGLAAALASGLIARRLGFGRRTALGAALAFLSLRMVVWEMATAEVDVAVATTTATAMLLYLAWRRSWDAATAVLLGVVLGAGLCIKHHGLPIAAIFGAVMLVDLVRAGPGRGPRFGRAVLVGAVALACFLPHTVWMVAETGNPLFPLFHHVLFPGAADFFAGLKIQYGITRDLLGLLVTPALLSVAPMQHWDGMVLGAPYFLALAPLALLARRRFAPGAAACLAVLGLDYLVWFYQQSQQVRFLMPVVPLLAVFSAIGAGALWQAAAGTRLLKAAVALVLLALAANQAMFVGIYAPLRLPVALGLISPADYHARTPTMDGANFGICGTLGDLMQAGGRYLRLLSPPYYCPHGSAVTTYFPDEERAWLYVAVPPPLPLPDLIERFERYDIRWVVLPLAVENRRNDTGRSIMQHLDLSGDRIGLYVQPAVEGLSPVVVQDRAAVYDGRQVLERLRAMAAAPTPRAGERP